MTILASVEVLPLHAQVALLDAAWQDYPEWETGEEAVAFKAPSLTDPDHPPYPGFAVATRSDFVSGQIQPVRVQVLWNERPIAMRSIHNSILSVGKQGIEVGNVEVGLTHIDFIPGYWPLEIWVDGEVQSDVGRVVFALHAGAI